MSSGKLEKMPVWAPLHDLDSGHIWLTPLSTSNGGDQKPSDGQSKSQHSTSSTAKSPYQAPQSSSSAQSGQKGTQPWSRSVQAPPGSSSNAMTQQMSNLTVRSNQQETAKTSSSSGPNVQRQQYVLTGFETVWSITSTTVNPYTHPTPVKKNVIENKSANGRELTGMYNSHNHINDMS